jgi:hypothetical protein
MKRTDFTDWREKGKSSDGRLRLFPSPATGSREGRGIPRAFRRISDFANRGVSRQVVFQ